MNDMPFVGVEAAYGQALSLRYNGRWARYELYDDGMRVAIFDTRAEALEHIGNRPCEFI